MKLKLIQSGGFVGREKTAEEDISSHPPLVMQALKDFFDAKDATGIDNNVTSSRDAFAYSVEYDNKIVPAKELTAQKPELKGIIDKLMGELKY